MDNPVAPRTVQVICVGPRRERMPCPFDCAELVHAARLTLRQDVHRVPEQAIRDSCMVRPRREGHDLDEPLPRNSGRRHREIWFSDHASLPARRRAVAAPRRISEATSVFFIFIALSLPELQTAFPNWNATLPGRQVGESTSALLKMLRIIYPMIPRYTRYGVVKLIARQDLCFSRNFSLSRISRSGPSGRRRRQLWHAYPTSDYPTSDPKSWQMSPVPNAAPGQGCRGGTRHFDTKGGCKATERDGRNLAAEEH